MSPRVSVTALLYPQDDSARDLQRILARIDLADQVIGADIVHHEHAANAWPRPAFAAFAIQQVAHVSRPLSSQYEIAACCLEKRSNLAIEIRKTKLLQLVRELLERHRQWNLRLERLHRIHYRHHG